MRKAVEITVILADSRTNPPTLKLRDSKGHESEAKDFTTDVDSGDTVIWKPDIKSGISELLEIVKKKEISKDNNNLLNGRPTRKDGKLVGTIVSRSPGRGKEEHYSIGFKIKGDDKPYLSDPKLRMNN